MTDHELLELAAKAAQLTILGSAPGHPGLDVNDESRGDARRWWSPLTDDGDALRLAVKLGISIEQDAHGVEARVGDIYTVELFQDRTLPLRVLADSTRVAIVRCAAEIGKTMTA